MKSKELRKKQIFGKFFQICSNYILSQKDSNLTFEITPHANNIIPIKTICYRNGNG